MEKDGCWVVRMYKLYILYCSAAVFFYIFINICLLYFKSEGWGLVDKKKLQIIVIPPSPRKLSFFLFIFTVKPIESIGQLVNLTEPVQDSGDSWFEIWPVLN